MNVLERLGPQLELDRLVLPLGLLQQLDSGIARLAATADEGVRETARRGRQSARWGGGGRVVERDLRRSRTRSRRACLCCSLCCCCSSSVVVNRIHSD